MGNTRSDSWHDRSISQTYIFIIRFCFPSRHKWLLNLKCSFSLDNTHHGDKRFWKGKETFSSKEIQNLDLNVFLLYPKIRMHSENTTFPYCKCILHWCCTNSRKFFHNNHPNIVWKALLSNALSNIPGNRTPRILPATAEWPESMFAHASASASYHLYWPTQATKSGDQPGKMCHSYQIPRFNIIKLFIKKILTDYIVEPNSTLDV